MSRSRDARKALRAEILDRQRTEAALRESEGHLESIINHSPFLLTRCSSDLRYRYVSRAYAEMLRRQPEDISGKPIAEIMGEAGLRAILPYVEKVLRGERVEYESGVLFEGVGVRWLRVVYTPDSDAQENITGWIASILDLTDRKRSEAAMIAAANRDAFLVGLGDRLRDVTDPRAIMSATCEHLGRYLKVARAAYGKIEEDIGRCVVRDDYCDGAPSLSGRYILDAFNPAIRLRLRSGRDVVIADIDSEPLLTPAERAAHATLGIRACIVTPLFKQGRFVAALAVLDGAAREWTAQEVALLRDVAERTWSAVERAVAEGGLRESQTRLAAELSAMNRLHELSKRLLACADLTAALTALLDAAIALHGADMGNVQLYDSQRRVLTIAAARGFNQDFLDFFREVRADDDSACARALSGHHQVVVEDVEDDPLFESSRRAVVAAGVRAVQSTPLHASGGKLLAMVSTHFRRPHRPSERELHMLEVYNQMAGAFIERMLAENALREADRRKDQFLAVLGHELRNPLAALSNGILLLQSEKASPSTRAAVVPMLARQVGHTVRLVDDILDVSRIMQDRIEIRRQRVALQQGLDKAIEIVRPLVEARRGELVVDMPAEPIWLDADPVRVTQVFENIISNAARYSPEGARIEISADCHNDAARVRVRDQGIGIRPDQLPLIFTHFVQVPGAAHPGGGLGLGLGVVRKLVEMHGGSVEAFSAGEGRGSEFVVHLPAAGSGA